MWMQDPGSPHSRETLPEAPGCLWELGRPVGLSSLIQREQELRAGLEFCAIPVP